MARPLKYNPAFMSDGELLSTFCVRRDELGVLLGCAAGEGRHALVTGVRGSGKTMLLRRFVAEIRRDARLSSLLCPVAFAEENYEILSLDDLWLQTLYYIAPATSMPHIGILTLLQMASVLKIS